MERRRRFSVGSSLLILATAMIAAALSAGCASAPVGVGKSSGTASTPTATAAISPVASPTPTVGGPLEWSTPMPISIVITFFAISCADETFCMAVGIRDHPAADVAVAYNNGSWSSPVAMDTGAAVYSVSCASNSFCVAVDTSGRAVTFNGQAWSVPKRISPILLARIGIVPEQHILCCGR